MDSRKQYRLSQLLLRFAEGTVSDTELTELEELALDDGQAVEYCVEFLMDLGSLRHSGQVIQGTEIVIDGANLKFKDVIEEEVHKESDSDKVAEEGVFQTDIWRALAENERNAAAIVVERKSKEQPQGLYQPIQKQAVHRSRRVSRLPLYTSITSTAALIIMMVYVVTNPKPIARIVATLTESVDAQWAEPFEGLISGSDLRIGSMNLLKGFAQIRLDDGAEIILEAPVSFELESDKAVFLRWGKISAYVPRSAIGFTVNTPAASIVDLGTEFGVIVDYDGRSDLHMFNGKASLIAGKSGSTKDSLIVSGGSARRVDSHSGDVQDIMIHEDAFVRHIDSRTGFVWRGEDIDLADFVGGGNGFGSGRRNQWISLETGDLSTNFLLMGPQRTDNNYHPVPRLLYIDGVFAPDGGAGQVKVSSRGHVFTQCPDTCGMYYEDIFNGDRTIVSTIHGFVLNGVRFGTTERSAIATHVNAGITFDLDAIRSNIPGVRVKIVTFTALCGVSEEVGQVYPGNVSDFYVLVDGEKRFEATGVGVDSGPRQVVIEFTEQDRFLTLVSTDGDLQMHHDWSFFAVPKLKIEIESLLHK